MDKKQKVKNQVGEGLETSRSRVGDRYRSQVDDRYVGAG